MKFILEINFENGGDEDEFENMMQDNGMVDDLRVDMTPLIFEFIYHTMIGVPDHEIRLRRV